MKVQAIIPAAGSGTRLKSDVPKPLISLAGKYLLSHTLTAFEECGKVNSIILLVPKEDFEQFKITFKTSDFQKLKVITVGGRTRDESVQIGLENTDEDTDIVIVHDAARPLVTSNLIAESVEACEQYDAVLVGVPVKPTIKRVDSQQKVVETISRSELWEAQTPQVFKRSLLLEAHAQKNQTIATDDAMLVEQLGRPVHMVMGDYSNIKVTTPDDIEWAEMFLAARK